MLKKILSQSIHLTIVFLAVGGLMRGEAIAANPNVLFIAVDDLNDFTGFMGHPDALTPNMDSLAAQGMTFTNAHVNYPICNASRASLMSGLSPRTLESTGNLSMSDDWEVTTRAQTLGTDVMHMYFADHGYKTMAVGKLFHTHVPSGTVDMSGGRGSFTSGLGRLCENWCSDDTLTDWAAQPASDDLMPDYDAAAWAVSRLQETHTEPFLLMVGFLRPHVPWYVPQQWFDLYDKNSLTLPPYNPDDLDDIPGMSYDINIQLEMPSTEWAIQNDQWRNILQAYLASISFVDHYIGQILGALENSPYKDNTVVVLWSDHGYHMGEKNSFQKHSLWQRSSHIPLVIAGPGVEANQQCDRVVSSLDIYPTLLSLCNLPENTSNEGRSLLPLIQDPALEWPYPAVTTWNDDNTAVQNETHRYMLYKDGSEELYDHRNDLNEWNNLASLSESYAIMKEMRESAALTQSPFLGSAYEIGPAVVRIEAEDFDDGQHGIGLTYYDATDGNSGSSDYRPGTDVDLEPSEGSESGGINVGYTEAGEWLGYTVDVTPGKYTIRARIAAEKTYPKGLRFVLSGQELGTLDVVGTGGFQEWQTMIVSDVDLPGGANQILKVEFLDAGVNLNWLEFESVESGSHETDPPVPGAVFSTLPCGTSCSAISMTAVTGQDVSLPVKYLFTETSGNSGGSSSGWQTSPGYTDAGLFPNKQYSYTVTVRDAFENTTPSSDSYSAVTLDGVNPTEAIFSDGFEDCFANWINGGAYCSDNHYEGFHSCKMNNDEYVEAVVDTTGFSSILVSYVRKTSGLEAGNSFFSEWYDGNNWSTIEEITTEFSGWTGVSKVALPAGAAGNADFKLRFRVSSGSNYAYVDSVTIEGASPCCAGVADFDCDEVIDIDDLSYMAAVWLTDDPIADIAQPADKKVDLQDLSILAEEWFCNR